MSDFVIKSDKSTNTFGTLDGCGELRPGVVGRRYDPVGGISKHKARIDSASKEADNKNLPFSFRKPFKPKGRSTYIKCDSCGYISIGTTATVGKICLECKKYSSVSEVNFD